MKLTIEVDVRVCKHPPSSPERQSNGLLKCKHCGSQFPQDGTLRLWANGLVAQVLDVKTRS